MRWMYSYDFTCVLCGWVSSVVLFPTAGKLSPCTIEGVDCFHLIALRLKIVVAKSKFSSPHIE